ncbi:MAG: phosphoribosylaminoimidazolesuccinocarboxamide synthase, partial [Ignavibacteria bacterium]|nr:phosphoribosylaminoimidazolesuccinocarboxamide synthase [Ignavibacteria bacterium]
MKVITQTNFPDLKLFHRGKVRDIYDLGEHFLFVATDRISAFDVVFNEGIPYKGYVLTQLSLFWFNYLKDLCENHLVASKVEDFPSECQKYKEELEGRSLLVKKVKIFPVECIVRGFISGSAWSEYKKSKTVCGVPIEQDMVESEKFNETLFTPSTKAEIGLHDENISYDEMVKIIGEGDSKALKELSIKIYTAAYEYALQKGIIIADT